MTAIEQHAPAAVDIPRGSAAPYRHRPIRHIGLWRPGKGWTFKIYGINVDAERNAPATVIDGGLLRAANETVLSTLPAAGVLKRGRSRVA